jgi:hypothetical protein
MENLKHIFGSDSWIITSIPQGMGEHRIDAKRRFPVADKGNFFSKWGSNKYLEKLSRENYGKKLNEFSNYKY